MVQILVWEILIMALHSYCTATLFFLFSFTFSICASQDDDSEEKTGKRKVLENPENESSKKKKGEQRLGLIEDLKQKRREAVNGERPWVDVLQEEKRVIAKKLVTAKELGIESRSPFLPYSEVEKIPVQEQYEAILKVRPDDRQFIPEKVREAVLNYHLEVMGEDNDSEKIHTMRVQLGLIKFQYTNSQESAISVELPKIDRELGPLKAQLGKILKLRPQLEADQKKISARENKSPEDIARLDEISEALKRLADEEEDIVNQRLLLAEKQKPFIQKVTRGYSSQKSQPAKVYSETEKKEHE